MNLIKGLFHSHDKPQNSLNDRSYSFLFGPTTSGKSVNENTAMQMTAVYSCVRILSEAVAGLPLHLYQYTENGSKEKDLCHPLYRLLHDEPNPEMTSFAFRETLMSHLLLWGNAYAQIIRNARGEVLALYPLMPNKMTVDRDEKETSTTCISVALTIQPPLARVRKCISNPQMCCTFLVLDLMAWLATAPLLWQRTPSVWQSPVRNTARSSSPTVQLQVACWSILAPSKTRRRSRKAGTALIKAVVTLIVWPYWRRA